MHDSAFIVVGFLVAAVIGLKTYLTAGTNLLFGGFTKLGGAVPLARALVVNCRTDAQHVVRPLPLTLLACAGFKLTAR